MKNNELKLEILKIIEENFSKVVETDKFEKMKVCGFFEDLTVKIIESNNRKDDV